MSEDQPEISLEDAVWHMFDGVVPERNEELKALFDHYQPRFNLVDDIDQLGQPILVMQGGAYVHVEANHRMFRTFWYATYVIWDAYSEAASAFVEGRSPNASRLAPLLNLIQETLEAIEPSDVDWGEVFPEPGRLRPDGASSETIAPGELAVFAAAWAVLHEIRHLQHQQDGTSSTGGSVQEAHQEELDCDSYAAVFMLEQVDRYAAETGEDAERVKRKRRLGVIFGVLVTAILRGDDQSSSDTHPSTRDRLLNVMEAMGVTVNHPETAILISAAFGLAAAGVNPLQASDDATPH